MLRLPKFELASPTTVGEAVAMLASTPGSMLIAGGTDLLPNVKHELFTPPLVVSLADIAELRGIRSSPNGWTAIGAMTSLADVAAHELVNARFPALAQAAGLVAGPQLRTMGTLGGNVLLDTRCQWYNQTYFWRQALGFCLKKDGTLCHVVEGGSKCVAAASNDTAPPLMTLRANLVIEGPNGRRTLPIDDLWLADGAYNKKLEPNEVLVEIQIPPTSPVHRGSYGKLRERGSIDFPLFGVAVRLELDAAGAVDTADAVVTAMQARPLRLKRFEEHLKGRAPGTPDFDAGAQLAADSAYAQCRPMPNIPGDDAWRREMVPVYVRRTILAASRGEGPVHHV